MFASITGQDTEALESSASKGGQYRRVPQSEQLGDLPLVGLSGLAQGPNHGVDDAEFVDRWNPVCLWAERSSDFCQSLALPRRQIHGRSLPRQPSPRQQTP
jgi:hypothetical protein